MTGRQDGPVAGPAADFRLPDLYVPCPAPPHRPDAGRLRAEVCDWAEHQGLIGPRGRTRLLTSRLLDLGIGLTGGAPPDRAAVLLSWFLWVLLLDDRVDDGPWADGGVLEDFAGTAVAVVCSDTTAGPADDPMLRALAGDLWPRTARLAGPDWCQRFTEHFARHLWAQCVMVRSRASAADLDLTGYVGLRRDLFGADLFFDLFAAVDGLDGPGVFGSAAALRDAAADVIAWTNDIFSVAKDLAFGEGANLVMLLHDKHGGTWQRAVDAARDMVVGRTVDFRAAAADPAVDARFADRLAGAMRASLDWHRDVPRYHWQGDGGQERAGARVDTRRTPPSMLSPRFEEDPYPLYRRLREDFPIVWDEPLNAWLVSRHEDVRAALADPCFTPRNYGWQLAPMFGRTVMQMEDREHAAHRAFLTPAFRGRALARLTGSVERVAAELVDRLRADAAGGGTVDLAAGFCQQLPVNVVVTALGLPSRDVPLFQEWYRAGFSYLGNYRQDPATLDRGLTSRDELYAYLDPHVADRRARPGEDLLSVLCTVEVDGAPLPDDMIKGFCGTLLGAGGETTDKALTSLLANLLDHPEILARVRDEPGLVAAAWAESLRRDPPVQVVLRQTARAAELPSGTIPADATVACLVGSANRDPERFAEPDRFDPDRTDGRVDREFTGAATHLAFGAGRHFCLGAQLARLEAEIGVRTLLAALPDLRWADGFTPVAKGLLTRAPERLLVAAR
ncbi:cytochrome P450 [Actinomadura hibisca]|uniref:cytochrome P450 n=1 Tax=Actinomadura hibisca TaxID=68565 RepID=UPI000A511D69|nr:cytochrome P450 [Actinomadura hibisca]